MRLALTGNPNSGKTTMYNALTGKNEDVGNWAGVTVEKKEHSVKKSYLCGMDNIIVVDLPGAYSMSPFTSEESIASTYIKNDNPDVIINIVDATNLSRSLFFTTQILELGIPVVVALNKTDINRRKETVIDVDILSKKLNCPVVETVSTSANGLREVIKLAASQIGKTQTPPYSQKDIDVLDKSATERADRLRFDFVNQVVELAETRKILSKDRTLQDRADIILAKRWVGIPFFALIMYAVFWISQSGPGVWISDWLVGILEGLQAKVAVFFAEANPLLSTLLIDGIFGGVIAVIGFLPLVMVMYFLIAILEDCGYMARVSVVLDPIFKKVGLSGKSVIPFVIATGCAVPGVMASRTIRDERERRATAMLTPFMPCGAKLPVIALFAGAFFKGAPWVGPLMYFSGIVLIFFGALLVNKITAYKAKKSFFIIELPEYKVPSLWRSFKLMCDRGWAYIVKAATIILLCNTAVQIMQTFNWSFTVTETADSSILESIAHPLAYLLIPVVGYHTWQLAAAAVTGFIAKENVVATLAVCFTLTDITKELPRAAPELTAVAALAYLMFNLYSPPCVAAIGAMSSEMKSAKWLWAGICLQLGTGFTVGYLVYQIGTLITTGAFGMGFVPGLTAVLVMVAILFFAIKNSNKAAQKGAK